MGVQYGSLMKGNAVVLEMLHLVRITNGATSAVQKNCGVKLPIVDTSSRLTQDVWSRLLPYSKSSINT